MTQSTFIDTLLGRCEVTGFLDILALIFANLGPTTDKYSVVDRPYRNAVGGLVWLAGVTRTDMAGVIPALARQSHY